MTEHRRAQLIAESLEQRMLLSTAVPLANLQLALRDPDTYSYSTGTRAYYVAGNNQIISTDGTPQGTHNVIGAPQAIGDYQRFLAADGYLYFDGTDAQQNGALYRMNLTTEQVTRVSGVWQTLTWGNAIRDSCVLNGKPYFLQRGPQGVGIYSVNDSGQYVRAAYFTGLSFQVSIWGTMTVLYDRLIVLFYGSSDNKTHLWTSDGTTGGTTKLATYGDVPLDNYGVRILEPLQGKAVYVIDDDLYRTDGTVAGTVLIQNMGDHYYVLASQDRSVVAVYPFDNGIYTKTLAYTDGQSVFSTTIVPGAKQNNRDPAVGSDGIYVNANSGIYKLTLDGTSRLSTAIALRNLSVVDETPYFATYLTIGRIQGGHTEHIFKTSNPSMNADGNGFLKVAGGFTFYLGGTIYFAPPDLLAFPNLAGTIFHDDNRNGVQDAGESHDMGGIRLHIDLDNDGIVDGNESTIPLDPGYPDFDISGFDPGTITLRLIGFNTLFTLEPNEALMLEMHMGEHNYVVIRYDLVNSRGGRVTKDLDVDDAIDSGEPGVPNVNVYADLNGNRVLDSGEPVDLTDNTGRYLLRDVPAGTFPLRVELPLGWFATYPLLGDYTLNTGGGYTYDDTFHFAITDQIPNGVVLGKVFNDLDRDGIRDANEPNVTPMRVWLDLDSDGTFDPDEPSSTSSNFAFKTRKTGTMRFGYILPGWASTSDTQFSLGSGERITRDLGLTMPDVGPGGASGTAFIDQNGNGVFDPAFDAPQAFARIWLDDNNDLIQDAWESSIMADAAGRFTFNGVSVGTHYVQWRLPTPTTSYSPTTLGVNFEPPAFNVTEGMNTPAATNVMLGSSTARSSVAVTGRFFVDRNLNGVFDGVDTLQSTQTNVRLFIDLNYNGVYNAGVDREFTSSFTTSLKPNRYALGLMTLDGGYVSTTSLALPPLVVSAAPSATPDVGIAWPAAQPYNIVQNVDAGLGVVEFRFNWPVIDTHAFSAAIQFMSPQGTTVPFEPNWLNLDENLFRVRPLGTLPDGPYSLRIPGSVLAGTSSPPPPDFVMQVPILRGDLNADRVVNFTDLLILAQNYGQSGRTYSQGNIDYDAAGMVDFVDLLQLSQRYGLSMATAGSTTDGIRRGKEQHRRGVAFFE